MNYIMPSLAQAYHLKPSCENLRQHNIIFRSDFNIIVGAANHHDLDAYPLNKRGIIGPIEVISVCCFIGLSYNRPFQRPEGFVSARDGYG